LLAFFELYKKLKDRSASAVRVATKTGAALVGGAVSAVKSKAAKAAKTEKAVYSREAKAVKVSTEHTTAFAFQLVRPLSKLFAFFL
jgi:hypothetical protein